MSGTISFAAMVVRTTERALLLRLADDREVWAPRRAVVTSDGDGWDIGEGYVGTFEAPLWWATQENVVDSQPEEIDHLHDAVESIRAVKQLAVNAPRPTTHRAQHDLFGEGAVLEYKGDKVVARFPTFGVRTLLRSKVKIIEP